MQILSCCVPTDQHHHIFDTRGGQEVYLTTDKMSITTSSDSVLNKAKLEIWCHAIRIQHLIRNVTVEQKHFYLFYMMQVHLLPYAHIVMRLIVCIMVTALSCSNHCVGPCWQDFRRVWLILFQFIEKCINAASINRSSIANMLRPQFDFLRHWRRYITADRRHRDNSRK